MSDLDRELEQELHRVLDPLSAGALPPRRAVHARGPIRTVLGGTGAALTIKVLSGVVAAAAAITVVGATATGSLNPTVWGQDVSQQVAKCKAQLGDGQHGIGDCVSSFANQHGQTVASNARQHGNGAADGKDKNSGGGNGNGNGSDKSKSKSQSGKDPAPPTVEPGEPTDPSTHGPVHVTPGP